MIRWYVIDLPRACCKGKISLVSEKNLKQKYSRVDNSDHTLLAVVSLTTVVPDWFGVVDHDSVRGHHSGSCFDGHEAREEAIARWHVVLDGLTWLVER